MVISIGGNVVDVLVVLAGAVVLVEVLVVLEVVVLGAVVEVVGSVVEVVLVVVPLGVQSRLALLACLSASAFASSSVVPVPVNSSCRSSPLGRSSAQTEVVYVNSSGGASVTVTGGLGLFGLLGVGAGVSAFGTSGVGASTFGVSTILT